MEYEVVIGLEVHAELATNTKIFCGCSTTFGAEPNTQCCPICLGYPGVLPVLNKKVIEYAVKAGLATNCSISRYSIMDRKHYFYPDLSKAFQTSQLDHPLCYEGYIEIETEEGKKKIGLTRIHIEEDAGKLVHDQWDSGSLIDSNRGGVPLIEIVSEPDIRSAEEAKLFLEKLKAILEYIEVSDCKMQEGSFRADVNLSVRPKGQEEFGTRTEMKNLNSFKSIVRAIEYETKRHIEVIENGGTLIQETRRWDDVKGQSFGMRSKEEAEDYRYFPEPDIAPIVVDEEWLEHVEKSLPELQDAKMKRYIEEYNLPEYDASIITSSKFLANLFDEAKDSKADPKIISNWIMGEVLRTLNEKEMEPIDLPITGVQLSRLINLVETGKINNNIAKKVFSIMFNTGEDPEVIVKKEGLEIVSDEGAIKEIVETVLNNNAKSVSDYRSGKSKAFGFLVGQVMRETKGKANPQLVNKLLKELLN